MAEAAAVIGLVASIASLVELTAKVVSRLHEFTSNSSEVPESFRSLPTRLPLLTATLHHIQSQAEHGRFPDDVAKALKAVVDDTSKQVSDIQISLSMVLPSDGASKFERALKALKSLAKEDKIQRALERIYGSNDILVLHQTTQHVDTGDRILEALSKLSGTPPTLSCPSSNIPFRRDSDFVNRGDIVDELYRKCALPASRTVLVGLGGVGKSQLAIELGYRIREQSPGTWVLWAHAGSMARLEQSFRDIAENFEIPRRQDPKANVFRLVHDWLRGGKSGQWLLILDNVDSPNLLSEVGDAGQRGQGAGVDGGHRQPVSAYLPQSQNGSILVTSRSQAIALKLVEEKDIVVVQPMTPAQALSLFEKKLGLLGQGNDTAELAAAYISQKAPRYSVQQYLEDFQKSDRKRTSLLNYEGGQLRRDWQAQNSIIITWQISFEQIRETRPSAADLLSLMSFFDRQGIPETLVRNRAGNDYGHRQEDDKSKDNEGEEVEEEEEEEEKDSVSGCSEDDGFEDDVQTLRNYSFISVGIDRTFEMHALVQLATRKWLEANEKLEQWKQCYIKNLSAEFPTGEYENWTYCQTLFPHAKSAITQRPKAEGSLRDWASLLHNAAWYAWKKGSINEAVEFSEMAMKVRKKVFGQEHWETLHSIAMVGLAYSLGGRWKEAEELEVQVVELSKSVRGEEHPNTLICTANLALTYWNQGRWKKAEELQVQVLEIRKRVLGEEHPNTLTSISDLAVTYWDQGRWKEAEELQVQVLETRKRILSEDHPSTLCSIDRLAVIYRHQGRWKEAEELQVQALEISKRVLGKEQPDTLISIINLAITYTDQGRWKEAEELQVQVIEISKRVLGKEHPHTLTSISNLAVTYWNQGRWKEAEELHVWAMETRKKVLGEEHPDTLTSMYYFAILSKDKGEDEKALALMEECVQKQKHVLGQDHPSTKRSEYALRKWRMEGLHLGSSGMNVNSTAAGE